MKHVGRTDHAINRECTRGTHGIDVGTDCTRIVPIGPKWYWSRERDVTHVIGRNRTVDAAMGSISNRT